LNGRFYNAGCIAAKNVLQLRGNAASAIAARASGRFVPHSRPWYAMQRMSGSRPYRRNVHDAALAKRTFSSLSAKFY
jgi:hypothetical protein